MEGIAVVVMLLALLALAGVVTFFLWDYYKHKDDNVKEFKTTDSKIQAEQSDRLSNIKFVVDQVNSVNEDMYKNMSSNVDVLRTTTYNVSKKQDSLIGGVDKFLKFSSNISISSTPQMFSLMDLPGTAQPNVHLMQHVNAVMGLTVSDLSLSNIAEFCNPDKTKCIRFPNSDGDTYLTSLQNDKNVVVDAPLKVTGDVKLMSPVSGTQTTVQQGSISAVQNGMVFQTGNVGIGTNGFSNPTAALHIQSVAGKDAFKVSVNAGDAILVKADGELVTAKPIRMVSDMNNINNAATLSIVDGPSGSKILKIDSNKVEVTGDLAVSGSATVKGLTVQTVSETIAP